MTGTLPPARFVFYFLIIFVQRNNILLQEFPRSQLSTGTNTDVCVLLVLLCSKQSQQSAQTDVATGLFYPHPPNPTTPPWLLETETRTIVAKNRGRKVSLPRLTLPQASQVSMRIREDECQGERARETERTRQSEQKFPGIYTHAHTHTHAFDSSLSFPHTQFKLSLWLYHCPFLPSVT